MTENNKQPGNNRKFKLPKNIGFPIFVLIMVVVPFIINLITGSGLNDGLTKFWEGQLITFFIMAVLAMSYDLLMGYSGILSFGHAAFFGGGAYTMALILTHWGPDFIEKYRITTPWGGDLTSGVVFAVGLIAAVIVSLLIGLLFSATSIRLKGAYFAMLTLALGEALHIISKATDFVEWTGADEGLHGVPVPEWLNPTQHRLRFYFIALIFMVICYYIMKRIISSPTGRVIIASRENESRIRMIGYNPVTYRTITFLVSAVFAGLAGALYSMWNLSATPSMTSAVITINAMIMVILGGMGTLVGPIAGAGIMQIFSHFLYGIFGARWPLVFGIIFILIVLFVPYGIMGTIRTQWPKFRRWLEKRKQVKASEAGD